MRQMYLCIKLQRTLRKSVRIAFLGMAASLLVLLPAHPALADSPAPTVTTLTAQASETGAGETLTATVATTTGSPVIAGTVDFELANGQSLGSAVVSGGVATLTLAKLPAGTSTSVEGASQLQIAAVYTAPETTAATAETVAAYTGSRSAVAAVASPAATVAPAAFTATGNPTTVTVKQGSYGTTVLTVTSTGGYTGSIQFSCSGLPAQTTCAFNPTQQNLTANGSFSSTLQLSTQGPSGTSTTSLLPRSTGIALAIALPGALALFGFAGRRRRGYRGIQMLGVALLLAGTGLGFSGCSQRYDYLKHAPSIAGGTPTGTFTITVAVDGSQGSAVSETDLPISLVVQ